MNFLGDYAEDETVYLMFNTFTSNDPSASSTITNFINTDVHIHKDDGLTQRNNAAGITVSVDFDGVTGSHMIKIDTSDDTVGGFWVTGSDYFVRIEGTTIDGATINAVVGHFSIENRYNPTMRGTDNAALASVVGALVDAAAAGEVTEADTLMKYIKQLINILIGTPGIGTFPAEAAPANAVSLAEVIRAIHVDVTGLNGDAMRGTNSANTTVPDAAGTAPTVAEIQTEMEEDGASLLDTIRDELANGTDGLSALKALIDAIPTTAMRGTDNAALASGVDITHIMGTILTEGGAGRLAAAFIKLFDVVTPLLIASDVMRGTDGANTTTPPTVTEIQAEMEENEASILDSISDLLPGSTIAAATDIPAMVGTDNAALASVCTEGRLGELAGANVPADIDTLLTRITAAVALASVCTEGRLAELAAANLPTDIDAIKAKTDNQPAGVPKNVALSKFPFLMIDSTDHLSPKTGLTVTAQTNKDGAGFTGSTNSPVEVASGWYEIDWTQAEMNFGIAAWKFTATGADQRDITIKTST